MKRRGFLGSLFAIPAAVAGASKYAGDVNPAGKTPAPPKEPIVRRGNVVGDYSMCCTISAYQGEHPIVYTFNTEK